MGLFRILTLLILWLLLFTLPSLLLLFPLILVFLVLLIFLLAWLVLRLLPFLVLGLIGLVLILVRWLVLSVLLILFFFLSLLLIFVLVFALLIFVLFLLLLVLHGFFDQFFVVEGILVLRVQFQCLIVGCYSLRVLALLSQRVAQIIFCISGILPLQGIGGIFIFSGFVLGNGLPSRVVERFCRLGMIAGIERLARLLVAGLPEVLPFQCLGRTRERQD